MLDLTALDSGRILMDCDDVLLDWLSGFRRFVTEDLEIHLKDDFPGGFDMRRWLGVETTGEAMTLVKLFNDRRGTGFDELGPIPGAVSAVQNLKDRGFEIHVITSCSGLRDVHERRWQNLEQIFGSDAFASLVCLEIGRSKKSSLAQHPKSVWIDDLPKNALIGQELGHPSAVLRAHHNITEQQAVQKSGLVWLEDWDDTLEKMFFAGSSVIPDGP